MASQTSTHEYTSELNIPYSNLSSLQTYDIHKPQPTNSPPPKTSYWIIYIHGGAWRDPLQSAHNITHVLPHLPPSKHPIAGIISLNYRLSEFPTHATKPSDPKDISRNARHPDHIQDVLAAIRHVQREYDIGENYVLAGHSCGAFLAFQVCEGKWAAPDESGSKENLLTKEPEDRKESEESSDLKLPLATVGIEGIYDLSLLVETHSSIPVYRTFVTAAFGTDEKVWKDASPVHGRFGSSWPGAKVAVVAHSSEDELVDWVQAERMSEALWREMRAGRRDVVVKLSGKHDDCWEKGDGVAKAVVKALDMLVEGSG